MSLQGFFPSRLLDAHKLVNFYHNAPDEKKKNDPFKLCEGKGWRWEADVKVQAKQS